MKSRHVPYWLILLLLLPVAGYLASALFVDGGRLGFPLDDSWIHLCFARNLAAGQGLSYNPGRLVTGSTAPLWTALLSSVFLLPGPPVVLSQLLALLFHLLAIDASFRLARTLGVGTRLAALAAALVGLTSWLVWSALAAMEVPLFLTLSLWGMVLQVRELRRPDRPPLALPLLALATLARPEGALLLLLAVGERVLRFTRRKNSLQWQPPQWRRLAVGLLLAAIVLLPVAAFYTAVGGSPLPTTYETKASYGQPGVPNLHYLFVVFGILFQPQPAAALLAAAGVLVLLRRWGERSDGGFLPALWLAALPLAYAVLSAHKKGPLVGNFGRYLFPLFPALIVMAALAVQPLAELPRQLQLGRFRLSWPLWLTVLLLLPTGKTLVIDAGRYSQNVLNVEQGDVRMAHFLASRLPPKAVLAVNDIGAVGYFLPNPLIDLAGIATPEVHRWARRSLAETGDYRPGILAYVRHVRPDYLLVFPNWFQGVVEDSELHPLVRLKIPDNITLGGDELVLYATPWTRYPLRQAPQSGAATGKP